MKIRIKGNSLRLRLTQTEVYSFAKTGQVSDTIEFNDSSTKSLKYSLILKKEITQVVADFAENEISVAVPRIIWKEWTETDMIGFSNQENPKQTQSIFILVEKDFQCMHERPNEDESDNYSNPMMSYSGS